MQKLEEIMRAEEAARHVVADAKAKAAEVTADAERRTREIMEGSALKSQAAIASMRQRRAAESEAEAGSIREEGRIRLEADISAAQARLSEAVSAAAGRIAG